MRSILLPLLLCLGLQGSDPPAEPFVNPIPQWTSEGFLRRVGEGFRVYGPKSMKTLPPLKAKPPSRGGMPALASMLEEDVSGAVFSVEGTFWVNLPVEKGTQLFSLAGPRWRPEALLEHDFHRGTAPFLVPLKNGRFLVFSPPPVGEAGNPPKLAPFAIYRANAKKLLELQDAGSFSPLPFTGHPVMSRVPHNTEELAFTEDQVVLVSPHYGIFWTFDLANGALRRVTKLFGEELTEKLVKARSGVLTVLHYQPMPDGSLLISTLHDSQLEELLTAFTRFWEDMRKMAPKPGAPKEALAGYGATYEARELEIRSSFPFLAWFTLDPATGKASRLPGPPPGALGVRDRQDPNGFWLADAAGTVTHLDAEAMDWHPFGPQAHTATRPSTDKPGAKTAVSSR